jgi:hypothetical protein
MEHDGSSWLVYGSEGKGFHVLSVGESGGHIIADDIGSKDDARLIAAAPDLLAALKSVYEAFDASEYDDSLTDSFRADLRAARLAIAKAEGGES